MKGVLYFQPYQRISIVNYIHILGNPRLEEYSHEEKIVRIEKYNKDIKHPFFLFPFVMRVFINTFFFVDILPFLYK